jgi:hypothetical protein
MLNGYIFEFGFSLSGLRFVFDKTMKYLILFVSDSKMYSIKSI